MHKHHAERRADFFRFREQLVYLQELPFEALQAADIKMFAAGECRTAAESLQRFAEGQLKPVHAAARGGFNRRGS